MLTPAILRRGLFLLALTISLVGGALLATFAWRDTFGPPVVRHTSVELAGLASENGPVRIALISDIHVAGPDMTPGKLRQIVRQINAERPDIVLIAGDMLGDDRYIISRRYSPEQAIAPLAGLAAPLGVFVAPGNHDHWINMSELVRVLPRHGVRMLTNSAVQAGPLVVGGLDDAHIGKHDVPKTLRQMDRLEGGRIILSHSPDAFPEIPGNVSLVLAGHTHCGQIVLPWGHAPVTHSRFGQRYACGRVDEGGKVLVTTAGLGTSGIPLRLFARPDIWIIEASPPGPN